MDWSQAKRAVFPSLKPTTRSISLRLPTFMLEELRRMANQRDVPCQSLIKGFLRERIDQEYRNPSNLELADGKANYRVSKQK